MKGSGQLTENENTVNEPERCTVCHRLAGMPTAPCGSCPDWEKVNLSMITGLSPEEIDALGGLK